MGELAWHAEFLLQINLKIFLRKTGARFKFKIPLITLRIDPLVGAYNFKQVTNVNKLLIS
jgi:hypothetical protein